MSFETGNGNPEVFDAEWREALASGDPRWLSYPAAKPRTQGELFEWVKAAQVRQILRRHKLHQGRILEYACGSAGMSVYLAKHGFHVVATDLSPLALQLALQNARVRGAPSERFSVSAGDVFRLPFPDETFDVVMSYGLLEHFTEETLVKLMQETNRVLRPEGLHIADIIHGRFSARTIATYLNFATSAMIHLARGEAKDIPRLYRAYFKNYYENKITPANWARLFQATGLEAVVVNICRPFPPLAASGRVERAYVQILKALLPFWRWFDRTDLPGLNACGWMYLVHGKKPASIL